MVTHLRFGFAALACAALLACGDDGDGDSERGGRADAGADAGASARSARPQGDFAGALEGTDALVGVVSSEDRVTIYVCDDGAISHWFVADLPAERSQLALYAPPGALLDAEFTDDDTLEGTVTLPDGREHAFIAERSDEPVLHRAVVDPSDNQRLIAGWVTFAGQTRGALELRTGTTSRLTTTAPSLPPPPPGSTTLPGEITLGLPLDPNDPNSSIRMEPLLSFPAPLVTLTNDTRRSTPNRIGTFVVAGAGDSYGSGEGAPVEMASSEIDEPDNLDTMWGTEYGMNGCHRSENAGIVQAFRRLEEEHPGHPMELIFVACGGSKIKHVIDNIKGNDATERTDRWEAIAERPQLEQILEAVAQLDTSTARAPIDVLAMSIGGNDAGFAPIVGACVTGGIPDNLLGIDPTIVAAQLGPTCDENPNILDAVDGNGPSASNPLRSDIPGWAAVADRYRTLDDALVATSAQRPIGQVLIQHYGAGFRGSDDPDDYCGGRTGVTEHDLFGFIDPDEARFVEEELVDALNTAVDDAAADANGRAGGPNWKPVTAHVTDFKEHGPCAPEPWTNTNNAALALQGNNLPDLPDDTTRAGLSVMNTVLSTAAGAAVGCTLGPLLCLAGGGFVGAEVGFVVGLATNAEESAVSAGMAHPNPDGYAAVADALYPELEAAFARSFRPARPDRLRQFGAVENGKIVIRWDDLSNTETRFEIEAYTLDGTTPTHTATVPANRTEYTHALTKAFVGRYRVRACNDEFCSSFTGFVKATNMKAGVPTGVRAEIQELDVLVNVLADNIMTVSGADPRKADLSIKIELTLIETTAGVVSNPTPQLFDSPFPFPAAFELGGDSGLAVGKYRVRAKSCNLLGCSAFSAPIESVRVRGAVDIEELELLPPAFIDKLNRLITIPLGDPEPEPGPGPDPSQPPMP